MILEMAAEWHMAPWQLEGELPALWADRWLAMRTARNEKLKRDSRPRAKRTVGRRLL